MIYNNSIKKRIHQYFIQIGLKDYHHGWMRGDCPHCDGGFTFGVHIDNNSSNCFKCGPKGNLSRVIMDLEGLNTWYEFLNFIKAFEESEFLRDNPLFDQGGEEKEKRVELPEGFRLLKFGDSQVSKSIRKYMEKRGYNIEEISWKGVGYCDRGDYFGHVIIPFYKSGELIYFNARNVLNNGPKFKNPKVEDFGVGKNMVAYNIDALAIYKRVQLVESATDALTLGNKAIALGGKNLSINIKTLIIKSSVRRITIFFDRDAIVNAIHVGLSLINYKYIKIVIPPDDRDINDLGRKKSLELERDTNYLSYQELIQLKLRYEEPEYTYN